MTEKRFNNVGSYLYDGDEPIGSFLDVKVHNDVAELLNEQHETIIKKDELLSKVLSVNSNYEMCLKEIDDVLSKHNIHTLEKLDQVLTNERTW